MADVILVTWNGKKAHLMFDGASQTFCDHDLVGDEKTLARCDEYSLPLCRWCARYAASLKHAGISVPYIRQPLFAPSAPKSRKLDATRNILEAIRALGGINPNRLRKAGWEAEYKEQLPKWVWMQIFRKDSTGAVDRIAQELNSLGYPVEDPDTLLQYLTDPKKLARSLDGPEPARMTELDVLRFRIQELERENQELREQLTAEVPF